MKLPMLPVVATRALQLAGNPEASFRDINRVIGPDAVISAKVISAANSAIYNTGTEVGSLMGALNRLGMGTLRDILYQAVAEAHFFRGKNAEALEEQRRHAVATGHAARLVANVMRLGCEHAFLAGLLHDIGRSVLSQKLQSAPPPELDEREVPVVVDAFHAVIGEQVAIAWTLPPPVAQAARCHHRYRGPGIEQGYSQIGNLVACAERALRRVPGSERAEDDACFGDLAVDEEQLAKIEAMIVKLHESLSI